MKEAPEKLYITNDEKRFGDKCHCASTEKYVDDDIEYTRTDAFVEKVEEFIYSALNDGIMGTTNIEDFMRLLKKYIEK